jgi:hypothetical protein
VFYSRRAFEIADTHIRLIGFYLFLHRIRRKVERDAVPYVDAALMPVVVEEVAAEVAEAEVAEAVAA